MSAHFSCATGACLRSLALATPCLGALQPTEAQFLNDLSSVTGFTPTGTFAASGNQLIYDFSLPSITNSDPGNGIRIRVDNADNSTFSSFRIQMTSGTSYNGIDGPVPDGYVAIPEPSLGSLLLSLTPLLLFHRLRR